MCSYNLAHEQNKCSIHGRQVKIDATRKRRRTRPRRAPFRKHFSREELDRIIAALGNGDALGLDAATEATYVLLDRIIARMSAECDQDGEDAARAHESFLKLVRAHNETTGRVAQLLRARQMIRGGAGEDLTKNVAAALDTLSEHFNEAL